MLNDIIPHCSERFPDGRQIWKCMRSRCVLDRNGKVMSRFSVVDRLDVHGMVTPRLAEVRVGQARLMFPVHQPLLGVSQRQNLDGETVLTSSEPTEAYSTFSTVIR